MRLPTEAEWEYAARAGSNGSRYGEIDQVAWYTGNSGSETHEVGRKQPNAWGLHDMLGNVWEWVEDWYAEQYPSGAAIDPHGPSSGTFRVLRGGSWVSNSGDARASVVAGTGRRAGSTASASGARGINSPLLSYLFFLGQRQPPEAGHDTRSNRSSSPLRIASIVPAGSFPIRSTKSSLSTVSTCETFTTLALGRLASPFRRDTLPGAPDRARFDVIRQIIVVAILDRLKRSLCTTTHGWRSAGAEPAHGPKSIQ